MPVGIRLPNSRPPGTLRVTDLKEGEMYRDDEGDWALVLAQDDDSAVCAVFNVSASHQSWFRYPYPHGSNHTFTGPYEAWVHIGPLKVSDPEGDS